MIPYAILFVVVVLVNAYAFAYMARNHHDQHAWLIGPGGWAILAVAAGAAALALDMNPLVSAVLGFIGGFVGVVVSFLYAMFTSPNGVK